MGNYGDSKKLKTITDPKKFFEDMRCIVRRTGLNPGDDWEANYRKHLEDKYGVIKVKKPKTCTDPAKLISGIKKLVGDAGKYTADERDRIYREHIESKYGLRR